MCKSYFLVNSKSSEVAALTALVTVMIRSIQQVCLVTIYIAKKNKENLFYYIIVAYKMFFSLYSVIINRPGEGSSEKNCCC